MSNLYGLLHDPDVWPNPDKFQPERFLDNEGTVTIPDAWIPFSIGKSRGIILKKVLKQENSIKDENLMKIYQGL